MVQTRKRAAGQRAAQPDGDSMTIEHTSEEQADTAKLQDLSTSSSAVGAGRISSFSGSGAGVPASKPALEASSSKPTLEVTPSEPDTTPDIDSQTIPLDSKESGMSRDGSKAGQKGSASVLNLSDCLSPVTLTEAQNGSTACVSPTQPFTSTDCLVSATSGLLTDSGNQEQQIATAEVGEKPQQHAMGGKQTTRTASAQPIITLQEPTTQGTQQPLTPGLHFSAGTRYLIVQPTQMQAQNTPSATSTSSCSSTQALGSTLTSFRLVFTDKSTLAPVAAKGSSSSVATSHARIASLLREAAASVPSSTALPVGSSFQQQTVHSSSLASAITVLPYSGHTEPSSQPTASISKVFSDARAALSGSSQTTGSAAPYIQIVQSASEVCQPARQASQITHPVSENQLTIKQSGFPATQTSSQISQTSQVVYPSSEASRPKAEELEEVPCSLLEVSLVESDKEATYIHEDSVSTPSSQTAGVVLDDHSQASVRDDHTLNIGMSPAGSSGVPGGSQEEEDYPSTVVWTVEATLKLIDLYKEHQVYLNDHHYKKKSVWEIIASRLRKETGDGTHYRWNQVENKWKNLTKKFRDCVDSSRRHHTENKCRFYAEIAAVYCYNPDDQAQKTAAEGLRALSSGSALRPLQKAELCEINQLGGGASVNTMPILNQDAPAVSERPVHVVLTKLKRPSDEDDTLANSITEDNAPLLAKKKKYARLDLPSSASASSATVTFPAPRVASNPAVSVPPRSSGTGNSPSSATAAHVDYCEDVLLALKQLRDDRQRQEKSRMEKLESMHREKMQIFKEFLELLKQSKQS